MEETIRVCDVDDCLGGKHVYRHRCKHDICSLCLVEIDEEAYCPICLHNAKRAERDY